MGYILSALSALAGGAFSFVVLRHAFASPTPTRPVELSSSPRFDWGQNKTLTHAIDAANRIVPQSMNDTESLRHRLSRAGLTISATTYHGIKVTLWAIIACIAIALTPLLHVSLMQAVLVITLVVAAALVAPRLILVVLARKRSDQIRSMLPKSLDLLAVGVEAGLTMDRAMHLFAQESQGALAYEFGIADREMNTLGFSRAEALQRMGERCAVDELSLFVGAVNASAAAGSPIAEVLRNQSEAAFERRRQHFEEQGNKLTSKMILPMGAFLVPAVLIAAIAPMIINVSATASGVI